MSATERVAEEQLSLFSGQSIGTLKATLHKGLRLNPSINTHGLPTSTCLTSSSGWLGSGLAASAACDSSVVNNQIHVFLKNFGLFDENVHTPPPSDEGRVPLEMRGGCPSLGCNENAPTLPILKWRGYPSKNGDPLNLDFKQLSLPFNIILIDHGLCLAPNGRPAKYDFQLKSSFRLINNLCDSLEAFSDFERFHRRIYEDAFSMLLANLRTAHYQKAQLVFSRRTAHKITPDNPARISPATVRKCLDFLAEKGLISMVVGKANEFEKNSSWCIPLPPLIALFEQHDAQVRLHKKAPLAVVRDDEKKDIPPYKNRNKRLALEGLAGPVRRYTETWLDHSATLGDAYLLPWLKRKFNNTMDYGGRFYGHYQNLPKTDRARILIDGARTVEPDYKAIHFSILYALEGLQFVGDPYLVPNYEHMRPVFKLLCLQLVNIENLSSFKACITRSGKPEIQRELRCYRDKIKVYNHERSLGLRTKLPVKPKRLTGVIAGLPEGVIGAQLIDLLFERHEAIKSHFGKEKIGLQLQKLDSEIMANALDRLEGIPCLPVHDSIRCKIDDSGTVIRAMKEAFSDVMGKHIEVDP
jgi:hypothetical protein